MKERGASTPRRSFSFVTVCFTPHHLQHQDVNPFTDIARLPGLEKGPPARAGKTLQISGPLVARLMGHHAFFGGG